MQRKKWTDKDREIIDTYIREVRYPYSLRGLKRLSDQLGRSRSSVQSMLSRACHRIYRGDTFRRD